MNPELTPKQQAAEDARKIADYEASRIKPKESPVYNELFPNGLGRLNEEVHTIARCLCAQADETRNLADAVKEQTHALRCFRDIVQRQLL